MIKIIINIIKDTLHVINQTTLKVYRVGNDTLIDYVQNNKYINDSKSKIPADKYLYSEKNTVGSVGTINRL